MSSWKEENAFNSSTTGAMYHASDLETQSFNSNVPSTLSDRNLMRRNPSVQGYDQEDEITISLLSPENETPQGFKERFKAWVEPYMKRESLVLLAYLVCLVIIGTSNRVTFKLMQYATVNYSYFISQLTTFVYLPVNFGVVLFKLLFTTDITPEQRSFPWYKFLVMGTLDSMQGLLIVVGGVKVPGIMQNLLMQGAVPVTMLFSIFLLRNRGCLKCLETKKILGSHNVEFVEETGATCTATQCGLTIEVHGHNISQKFNYAAEDVIREKNGVLFDGFLQRDNMAQVRIRTSAMPWGEHFRTYYTVWQYLGACIILAGLVVSVWPAFQSGGQEAGGPPLWDLVFFSSNIPTAISGVYKEIAFKSCDDMDVWWLNAWVALWQFTIGLSYAPLAAVMQVPPLPIDQIPQNMAQGFECVFEAKSTIVPDFAIPQCHDSDIICNTTKPKYMNVSSPNMTLSGLNCPCSCSLSCGNGTVCCDSCAGQYPNVSNLPAWGATLMYMAFNIAYNVFLLLVIKHGSAALMYIASTLVLPLGTAAFTIKAFMGVHAGSFNAYNGAGLGVILFGLIVYRFLGSRTRKTSTADLADAALGTIAFTITDTPPEPILIRPKTVREVRNRYYASLGVPSEVPGLLMSR